MGISPVQSVEGSAGEGDPVPSAPLDASLLDELWHQSNPAVCGLDRAGLAHILQQEATRHCASPGASPSRQQQAAYFSALKLSDLVLARACATGNDLAWKHFVEIYRAPLTRAAIAITGSETLGRDLADQLYAEIYGLTTRDGQRRCPLDSYRGRGSLMGWLRTTLAQRHVDHHRRSHREQPLDEFDAAALESPPTGSAIELNALESAVQAAINNCDAEDRLLLASYYLDGRTLQQIASIFHVHESTMSRKLKHLCEDLRKQVLKNLQASGMSRRAADEALGADPRDLDLNLKILLQHSQTGTFKEKAG